LRGASIQPAIIDDRADLAPGSEISSSAKTVSAVGDTERFRVCHPACLLEGDGEASNTLEYPGGRRTACPT
jgi:hypothetical protein